MAARITLGLDPPKITYSYTVEDHNSFYNTVVEVHVLSDGFMPSGSFYLYLLPLQTKVCLVTAVFIRDVTDDEDMYYPSSSNYKLISLDQEKEQESVEKFLSDQISKFSSILSKRLEEILDYRDREAASE